MSELPDPLTPPDCDLRGLPFMPLDVVRLIDSDLFAISTGDEFKAAVALWCKSWLQVPSASLPDDDRVLAHLSGAGNRWAKVKEVALRGWEMCSDRRLYHPVVAEKARDAWQHRLAQRARAARRWNKDGGNAGTPSSGNATASIRDTRGDAAASATAMQGRGTVKGKGRTPRGTPPLPDAPPQAASPRLEQSRGSRLSERWEPSAGDREYAVGLGLDADATALNFRDYWIAEPGKDGRKADWPSTWRRWCREDAKRAVNGSKRPSRNGFFDLPEYDDAAAD